MTVYAYVICTVPVRTVRNKETSMLSCQILLKGWELIYYPYENQQTLNNTDIFEKKNSLKSH